VLPSAPRGDCSNIFGCRECVEKSCAFCFDNSAFTLAVPGVCSANCSLIAPKEADGNVVDLTEDAHCDSLDDFISSRQNETTMQMEQQLHYCLLPGTTCLRCLSRRGCQWCATGFCVNETAMCDDPTMLLTREEDCQDFMPLTNRPPVETTVTAQGLGDLEMGLIIGGVLFLAFVLAAIATICMLRQAEKKRTVVHMPPTRIDSILAGSGSLDNSQLFATGAGTTLQTYGQGTSYSSPERSGSIHY
jgi:hypothetical protein